MNIKAFFHKSLLPVLLVLLALTDQILCIQIQTKVTYDYKESYRVFLSQQLPEEAWQYLFSQESTSDIVAGYLTAYQMLSGMYRNEQPLSESVSWELAPKELEKLLEALRRERPEEFARLYDYNEQIWSNLDEPFVFPVGDVEERPESYVSFEDSWNTARTYGGDRTHEGTDVMASINERGIYPILSVGSGVVENKGWLPLGGYRIGIRSTNGTYFYYAHLAEYAPLEEGDYVESGTWLGQMGDTGYSDVPGTTGNFPVHLHFGIYLNDENGTEFAVNSYPFLRYIEWRMQN